jgi:hypothetical protein
MRVVTAVVLGLFNLPSTAGLVTNLVFPRISCLLKLLSLDFDAAAFDRYDEFFRNDSVVQLVETGAFKGVDDILEYLQGGSEISPFYVRDLETEDLQFSYRRYDRKNSICEFEVKTTASFETDPTTTAGAVTIKYGAMSKLFLDYRNNYIVKQKIFLLPGFWEGLRFAYNSTNARNFVCEVMATDCAPYLPNGTSANCLSRLEALPLSQSDEDGTLRFQEGSQVCRVMHAGLARINPVAHCAHISFEPLKDPQGRIKCQEGSDTDNFKYLDLFTQEEINDFRQYCLKQGLGDRGAVITPVN